MVTNRSTQIGLGLAIAVVLAIVWALSRFDATSVEHLRSGEVSRPSDSPKVSALEGPTDEPPAKTHEGGVESEFDSTEAVPSDARSAAGSAPPRYITLHGDITDARGGPIHIDELLRGSEGQPRQSRLGMIKLRSSSGRRSSTEIDDRGHYSVALPTPGPWALFVSVSGYRPNEEQVVLSESDSDRRLDFALDPYAILHARVEVELDRPLSDPRQFKELVEDYDFPTTVHLTVTKKGLPGRFPSMVGSETEPGLTRKLSTTEVCSRPDTWVLLESIELHTKLPVYAALAVGNRVFQEKRVLSTDQELVFSITVAQLRSSFGGLWLRVVDDQGRTPETPCRVELVRSSGDEAGSSTYVDWDRWINPAATSSPDVAGEADDRMVERPSSTPDPGVIRLHKLHPGRVGLEIVQAGYAHLQLEAVVEPGVDRFLGQFRLDRILQVRGRVLNPNGTPADAQVEYVAVGDAADGASNFQPEVRPTDSLGQFLVFDAGPGRFRLQSMSRLDPTWASLPTILSAKSGVSVEGIVLQLLECTQVSVKLEKPPTSGVTMRIEDASGLLIAQQSASSSARGASAGFELVPGRYKARALSRGEEIATGNLVVGREPLRVVLAPR